MSPQRELSRILSSVAFHFHPQWISSLLKENYHGFCSQWPFIFIPQRICIVSPQRELLRILPLVALDCYPLADLYRVFSERTFTDFALSGFAFFFPLEDLYHVSSERTFTDFALSSFTFFIPQQVYTVSPQRELSRIFPLVALYFHPPVDLHCVSSERTITDFALNGFVFSSLRGFTLCLFKENYHGFYPQWHFHFHPSVDLYRVSLERCFTDFAPSGFAFLSLEDLHRVSSERTMTNFSLNGPFIFILQWIYTLSPQREFSLILPSVALHFYLSKDLHRVSSERTITDFALNGFTFSSLRGFTPCLLRENYHGFCPQWLYIFIPQRIYTVFPQRESSWILPSVALHFHHSMDFHRVSLEKTITDFALSGFVFSSLSGFLPCLLRRDYHGFCLQWPFIFISEWIYTVSPQKELS